MTVYEANRKIKEIENELKYLYDAKTLAFESTQPKAMKPAEVSVQSSHKMQVYTKLDYSIDEIEPRINYLEIRLDGLKQFVNNYYGILKEYDPMTQKIIQLREEYNLTWDKISEATHYSRRQCINIYSTYLQKRYVDEDCTSIAL